MKPSFFADAAFMDMFKPALVSGSYKNFSSTNSIFISEKFAQKYFDDEDPIGKEMSVSINNVQINAVVGGIIRPSRKIF
jgi:putative ABC transport system permease protein